MCIGVTLEQWLEIRKGMEIGPEEGTIYIEPIKEPRKETEKEPQKETETTKREKVPA